MIMHADILEQTGHFMRLNQVFLAFLQVTRLDFARNTQIIVLPVTWLEKIIDGHAKRLMHVSFRHLQHIDALQ